MNPSLLVASVLTGLAFSFAAEDGEAAKAELEKLQGTWQLISAEADGKTMPAEQVKNIRVVIKGSKHSVYFGDASVVKEIPFTIDPTKKPKQVTDTLPDGKQIKSIYELTGDTLRSCVAPPGKDRPKEFSGKAGTGHTLRVFKRVK
jgi:uncharacterized protein (TIGR03067 family)